MFAGEGLARSDLLARFAVWSLTGRLCQRIYDARWPFSGPSTPVTTSFPPEGIDPEANHRREIRDVPCGAFVRAAIRLPASVFG